MKKTVTGGIFLAAACAAVVPVTAAHASAGAAADAARPMYTDGCAHGTVCMYTHPPSPTSDPEHHWSLYGCYNLVNEQNTRWVFNNQYDGATAKLWTGKNCTGKVIVIKEGQTWKGNITPIYSVSLNK